MMNASKLLFVSALVLAASTTTALAAEPKSDGHPAAKPMAMVSDPHTTAGLYVIWDEIEKAKLEKQGFPQYSN